MGRLLTKQHQTSKSNLIEKESDKGTKPTRYYSNKQEKQIAKALNGTQTLNSGATPFQKGDVLTDSFLIEAKTKTTESKSISIKKEWLEKNNKEALNMGKKYHALAFNFGPNEPNMYIIDEYLFQDLIEYLNNKIGS